MTLYARCSVLEFPNVVLGISETYDDRSAAEHGLGLKTLAFNMNAHLRVFNLAVSQGIRQIKRFSSYVLATRSDLHKFA